MKTFAEWVEEHGLSQSEAGVAEVAWEAALSAQAADLHRFRKLASWVANCTGHGINDAQRRMGEELLALIDSQVKPK